MAVPGTWAQLPQHVSAVFATAATPSSLSKDRAACNAERQLCGTELLDLYCRSGSESSRRLGRRVKFASVHPWKFREPGVARVVYGSGLISRRRLRGLPRVRIPSPPQSPLSASAVRGLPRSPRNVGRSVGLTEPAASPRQRIRDMRLGDVRHIRALLCVRSGGRPTCGDRVICRSSAPALPSIPACRWERA
jgi:hypothetical protein